MIDILKVLNDGKDRCVLIGRNGLNLSYSHDDRNYMPFATVDYDIVCPDLVTAGECAGILGLSGFVKNGATFSGGNGGELDILIADPEYPEGVADGYYNVPSLRALWNARIRKNGVLVPDTETLIMNKLLFARENDGKDLETVSVYFTLEPERLEPFIKKICGHEVPEERETMLYSLYASMSNKDESKKIIEKVLLAEIFNVGEHPQHQSANGGSN